MWSGHFRAGSIMLTENTQPKMGQRQGLCSQWLICLSHGQRPTPSSAEVRIYLLITRSSVPSMSLQGVGPYCKGDVLTAAMLPGIPRGQVSPGLVGHGTQLSGITCSVFNYLFPLPPVP